MRYLDASLNRLVIWSFRQRSMGNLSPASQERRFSIAANSRASPNPAIGFEVNYHSGTTGFTSPTWNGYPAFNIGSLPPLTITNTLPTGSIGVAFYQELQATGGLTPYTWSLVSGSLPQGLSLSSGGTISGTAATATTASFAIQVSSADSQSTTANFTITITSPFAIWLGSVNFTESETASGLTTMTADFEGDGLPNLVEYALGGNPKVYDAATIAPVVGMSGNQLQISFNCDAAKTDISYVIQASPNLSVGSWVEIAKSMGGATTQPISNLSAVSDAGAGSRSVAVMDSMPIPAGGKRFLRLKIVNPAQ